jgi:hypothetical protein
MKHLLIAAVLAMSLGVAPSAQRGAVPQPPAAGALETPGITPAEIQRLFDAFALLQAQDQLKIQGDQSLQFLARFRDLQDVRRKTLTERTRRINVLRMLLTNDTSPDEAQMREQLKGLQDLDARAAADIRKAYDAIDQILDLRQQAKFRVFEENMERRKLELVTRARQANQVNRGRLQ